jgi:penicillin amidase
VGFTTLIVNAKYNRRVHARVIRAINVSIAILAMLVLIAAYWFAWRPLPKTSGTLDAPISAPATIIRDALGVPHVTAECWQDAVFLEGFVTAQDRLWQMDNLRRFAAGELAEIYGPKLIDQDRSSRSMLMRQIAESYMAKMNGQERELLVQFARGVNFFIRSHHRNYSLEFSLPHAYDPRPWAPTDSLLVMLSMFRDLTTSWKGDIARGELFRTAKDRAKAKILFPPIEGATLSPGSNAWAVNGAHTYDGKPMLASDPHLAPSIPSIFYMVHLKSPDLDVTGVTVPGLPGVVIGHNRDIAWGLTNMSADYQDVYEEQIDMRTGRYMYDGKQEQAILNRQIIGVYGSRPVEVDTWITRHGPALFSGGNRHFALRWSAADGFGYPVLDMDRARNWQEFRAAASRSWGPPQNFIFADRNGHIGYQATGAMPIRRGFTGELPLDGSSSKFEWQGYIPFDQLPSYYDPPGGIVASANQNPFPPDFPFQVDGRFAAGDRIRQIRARLHAKGRLTVKDMLAIQTDVYSEYDHFLATQVIAAFGRKHESAALLKEGIDVLRGWNGQMDKELAAPVITQLLSANLQEQLIQVARFGSASGKAKPSAAGVGPQPSPQTNEPITELAVNPDAVARLLARRPTGWVEDWDALLMKGFRTSMEMGRNRLGTPVSGWRYGRLFYWELRHPIGGEVPVLKSYFNIGPVPMGGAGTTVKQSARGLGPAMRMVVDFGNLEASVQNIATGESGHVVSSHYKDQWNAYYMGTSFPMQFDHIEPKSTLHLKPH